MDAQKNSTVNTDLNQVFSTITSWSFVFATHADGVIQNKVNLLCTKVAEIINSTQPELTPTEEDAKDLNSVMIFLMKHKEKFTIAEFMACLDFTGVAYKQLSTLIYASTTSQILANDEVERLKKELAKVRAQLASQSKVTLEVPVISRVRSDSESTVIASSFNFSATNPPPTAPTHLPNIKTPKTEYEIRLEERLENLSKKVDFQSSHVFTERVRVDSDPPVFKSSSGSMRQFGRKQYSRWARKQGLTAPEATLFFCMSFENEIESNHIDKLATDSFGRPKYNSVLPLIEKAIEDLKYSEESQTKIRSRFDDFYAKTNVNLDAEFLRCSELRELGWPTEGSIDQIKAVKKKFGKRVHMPNQLHALVFLATARILQFGQTHFHFSNFRRS